MSLTNFFRNYTGIKIEDVKQAVTEATVEHDPEGSARAELKMKSDNLQQLGIEVEKARSKFNEDKKMFEAAKATNNTRIAAAQLLQKQISETDDPAKKTSLGNSLDSMLATLEKTSPEIDRLDRNMKDSESFFNELQTNFTTMGEQLRTAKSDLDNAMRDRDRAEQERVAADQRAKVASVAAGLTKTTDNMNIALNAFKSAAEKDRQQAAVSRATATVLAPRDAEVDDPNIRKAMEAAQNITHPAEMSQSDRLAALMAKQ